MARIDVRAIRTGLGLSRDKFAALLPVDARTVRRWENNEVAPSPMACEKLAALQTAQPGDVATEQRETAPAPRRKPLALVT